MSVFELIRAEAAEFPIARLCTLLGVSTSGYYAYVGRPPSDRATTDERITTKLRALQSKTLGVYGSRRMRAELDESVGRKLSARRLNYLSHRPLFPGHSTHVLRFEVASNTRELSSMVLHSVLSRVVSPVVNEDSGMSSESSSRKGSTCTR